MTSSSREALPARSPMPLTQTFHLARPGPDSGQGVGHGHAQVIVAMHADHRVFNLGHVLADLGYQILELMGQRVAHRVRDVDGGGAILKRHSHRSHIKVGIAAAGVLGGKLHIIAQALGQGHAGLSISLSTSSRLILSLYCRWMSEVAMNT
jgi:hypothetical protein